MITDKSLLIVFIICAAVVAVSKIISDYKFKKNLAFFRMQLIEAKANLKEKQEYERRLNELGQLVEQGEQVKTLAHFYEVLNRSAVEYDLNPKAFPNQIQEALLNLTYKYTIIKNE